MIYSIKAAEFRTPKMGMTQKAATKKMEQSPARNYEGFSTAASNALKAQVAFKGNEAPKGITLGSVEGKPSISATLNGANRIADDLVFSNGEFLIVSKKSGDKREVEIYKKDSAIIKGFMTDELDNETEIKFNVAKHNPEIKVTKDGHTIQLFEGSYIKDRKDNFEFTFPGSFKYYDAPQKKAVTSNISFKGNYVSLLCKKDATVQATNNSKDAPFVSAGKYWSEMRKDDPSVVELAGGFGTRFANMTDENSNKPSFVMPNGQSLVGAAFDLAKNGQGLESLGNVTYLNQVSEENPSVTEGIVAPEDEVYTSKEFSSDGGAVINAVLEGKIPNDKPLVILNADTITNVDIAQSYHKLKSLSNAALVIPCYPVSETRAKAFGLMAAGALAHKDGSRELTNFVEKPANPAKDAKDAMIKDKTVNGEQAYRGNPGIYIFNKEVLQNLDIILETAEKIALTKKQADAASKGKPIPTSLPDPFSASTFLGNAFVPAVVQLCREGKLLNENGEKMKTYIVPMTTTTGQEAVWDDVGSAEAFVKNCQDIAYETAAVGEDGKNKYTGIRGLSDFRKSAILEDGVIFASPADKAHFEDMHAHEFRIKGNVYINSK